MTSTNFGGGKFTILETLSKIVSFESEINLVLTPQRGDLFSVTAMLMHSVLNPQTCVTFTWGPLAQNQPNAGVLFSEPMTPVP